MREREQAKKVATYSGNQEDWIIYHKLRNQIKKLNRYKNKLFFENKINDVQSYNKKLWNIKNDMTGRNRESTPAFIEADGVFITKSNEIIFTGKVENLKRRCLNGNDNNKSNALIREQLIVNKKCKFKLKL